MVAIGRALDEVLGKDAISESQVRRIHKAVNDGDETIFTDHRRSGAIRERSPISGNPTNIANVREQIIDDPHASIRALAARTGLSHKVIETILHRLGAVKKSGEFVLKPHTDTEK